MTRFLHFTPLTPKTEKFDPPPNFCIKISRYLHIGAQVLIRYLRSFSFCQKWLGTRIFSTFANKINFIVSKLNTQKSRLQNGKGNLSPDAIPDILTSLDRQNAGPTAPAKGLCLNEIRY